jgi:nicotinate-nucleotide--dimethylbenzimidazole phosphoribosyltransferase
MGLRHVLRKLLFLLQEVDKMSEKHISQLNAAIAKIAPLNTAVMEAARARQDSLAKPPHSLGRLEDITVRMAGITGKVMNRADKRQIMIFSADNGVVAEGVASAPQSVTLSQTINFARGLTGVATLARHYNTPLRVIDVGVNADFSYPGVENRKIAMGTNNIAHGPAMNRDQALEAICIGVECAGDAARDGIEILGIGEMGIGNTTTSSAILACLTGLEPEKVVGRGGGVNDRGFMRKIEIIQDAIAREKPDPADPIDVIAKVGGFDIAAMAGAFIGAASAGLPVVIDGFISAVAALCAAKIAPGCEQYMFASHASFEIGYARAIEALGLRPMFDLEMRLGEGSGCPIAFGIISAALAVINEMGTFADAEINDDYLGEIRADARLQR